MLSKHKQLEKNFQLIKLAKSKELSVETMSIVKTTNQTFNNNSRYLKVFTAKVSMEVGHPVLFFTIEGR